MLIFYTAVLALIMPASESLCGSAPHELAGFEVGDLVEHHRSRLREETVLPIRFFESLKEIEIVPLSGYKTGLVIYGTCQQPSRIIRLKFKYADPSKAFYDELLERFKNRFGEPDKWRGDPFGIVTAWKWSFFDEKGNDISLILQHNLKDDEEKQGNSVKLTMWNLMQAESRCFERKAAESTESNKDAGFDYRKGRPVDWDRFVPK
jgi:hypothetical protein